MCSLVICCVEYCIDKALDVHSTNNKLYYYNYIYYCVLRAASNKAIYVGMNYNRLSC